MTNTALFVPNCLILELSLSRYSNSQKLECLRSRPTFAVLNEIKAKIRDAKQRDFGLRWFLEGFFGLSGCRRRLLSLLATWKFSSAFVVFPFEIGAAWKTLLMIWQNWKQVRSSWWCRPNLQRLYTRLLLLNLFPRSRGAARSAEMQSSSWNCSLLKIILIRNARGGFWNLFQRWCLASRWG